MFSATATSRLKISRNCRSLSVNARGSGLSTLNVPITSSCSISGTVSELLASFGALQVERVFGRVFAQIALAGGGHEAGHAVVLRLGVEHAAGGLGLHAHRQQRLQPAGLLVQQADLDHVELQQVLGEVQDVRLQQFDAVA